MKPQKKNSPQRAVRAPSGYLRFIDRGNSLIDRRLCDTALIRSFGRVAKVKPISFTFDGRIFAVDAESLRIKNRFIDITAREVDPVSPLYRKLKLAHNQGT